MANRREVLQAGLAVPALSMSGSTGLTALLEPAAAGAPVLGLECFVCDERYAQSIAAARTAARHGLAVHVTAGDMTDLWYHRLDAIWRRWAVAIAGVTGEDALFVLERLGWDRGLRVIYAGRHVRTADGTVSHELTGVESMVRTVADAHRGGEWTERFAAALSGCGADVATESEVSIGASATGVPVLTLTSWLLAPKPEAKPRA